SPADVRWIGLQLSAGVAAPRRAARRAHRHDRSRRPRPDGPRLPGPACRSAGGAAAAARRILPHVQRLHHRSASRSRVRIVSARSVLFGVARSDSGEDGSRPRYSRSVTMTRVLSLSLAFTLAAAISAQEAPKQKGGYFIEKDEQKAKPERGPHDGPGQTVG